MLQHEQRRIYCYFNKKTIQHPHYFLHINNRSAFPSGISQIISVRRPWRRTLSAPSVWACGSVWAPPAASAGRSEPTLPSDGCRAPSAASPAGSPAHTAGTPPSPSWWILPGPSSGQEKGNDTAVICDSRHQTHEICDKMRHTSIESGRYKEPTDRTKINRKRLN